MNANQFEWKCRNCGAENEDEAREDNELLDTHCDSCGHQYRIQTKTRPAFEALRFTQMTTYGEDWKLNNNYTAHYSRLVMERCPDLDGFFRTREAA